jgi:hypothetical protein
MTNIILFPLKVVFYYPGRFILWFRYFFPTKNKKGGFPSVAESRRQYKEGGWFVAFLVSCGFWGTVLFTIFVLMAQSPGVNG